MFFISKNFANMVRGLNVKKGNRACTFQSRETVPLKNNKTGKKIMLPSRQLDCDEGSRGHWAVPVGYPPTHGLRLGETHRIRDPDPDLTLKSESRPKQIQSSCSLKVKQKVYSWNIFWFADTCKKKLGYCLKSGEVPLYDRVRNHN